MRKELYEENKDVILGELGRLGYQTSDELSIFLSELKESGLVSGSLGYEKFFLKLLDDGLSVESIKIREVVKARYSINKKFEPFEFANTLYRNGFFPMTSSLNIQGLTNFRDDFIFVSTERKERVEFAQKQIKQESIDAAFSKKPRRTKAFDKLQGYNFVMLESNNTHSYEIIEYNGMKVSSVNRAFVEIISNIHYFKSPKDVIEMFKAINLKLDIKKILKVIDMFGFVYPYYQLAGYYLEQIGFSKAELAEFNDKKSHLRFYTVKNKESYQFDEYWNIYY